MRRAIERHGVPALFGLILGVVVASGGCGAKHGLEPPIIDVKGTKYFIAEGRGVLTTSEDFSKKLAWTAASSLLARARSQEVISSLSVEQRANLEELLETRRRRGARITGLVEFVDRISARAPLRNVHELKVEQDGKSLVVVLGIPLTTWEELIDEAAEEVERALRGEVIDLEASQGGR